MHISSRISKTLAPYGAAIGAALAVAATLAPTQAHGQASPGPFVAVEGQRVFGDTDVDAGFVPGVIPFTGDIISFDEGDGWGGAITLGYAFGNGWRAAVRYRQLDADNGGGPVDPGIIGSIVIPLPPGVPISGPLGIPVGVPFASYSIDSEAKFFNAEVATAIAFAGLDLEIFGGVKYASLDRDMSIFCDCFALSYSSSFRGIGPQIGVRGGVPLFTGVSLVGSASVAALFGTSEFTSRIDDPLFPTPPGFKAKDDRTVAAIDAEAGISFAILSGQLTLGYRVDAIFDALDTDQRLFPTFVTLGLFPQFGNRKDDFVEHGPFARFSLPLSGAAN